MPKISRHRIIQTDCLEWMQEQPSDVFDLVFTSPPYEDSRSYGIDFSLKGQEWVDWMVEVVQEALRICKGLVTFVVEGKTRNFRYSATPILLMADLHRAGIHLRKPLIFQRVGIPGSGGPDWLRSDTEFIVCATRGGRLPWSDNTAMGHPPVYGPGGNPSHRRQNGERVRKDKRVGDRSRNGGEMQIYKPPKKANPGNIIRCVVGGGVMGSDICHENEAPFPEALVEFFVRSFCPPNGRVLDPFAGSGTVLAVCEMTGRRSVSLDVRESQVGLMRRRLQEAQGREKLGV